MQGGTTGLARSAARPAWIGETRRVLLVLLAALDRLVPSRDGAPPDRELPAERFKYPPI
jgi:hypothetical protein